MADNAGKPRPSRRWLWWAVPAAVVVALIVISALKPPQVEVAHARIGDLTVTVTATGEVEGRVADLSPTMQGRVEAVYREEGDWVNRGDVLCRITTAPGLPTSSPTLTANETVKAPFNGVVSRRHVDPGDAAIPGVALFEVADTSDVWVVALIDDIDIGKVHEGMSAEVSLPAYMSETFAAVIVDVGATAVPRTELGTGGKVVRARLRIDEPSGTLRPGMEVDVRAEAVVARDAVLVPADTIVENETARHVYVVREGRVRKIEAQVGANNYLDAVITSGIANGEEVVVGGKEDLVDGQRVTTVEVSE